MHRSLIMWRWTRRKIHHLALKTPILSRPFVRVQQKAMGSERRALVGTSVYISIQQHFNCTTLRRCMHPVPLYKFNFYQTSDLSVSIPRGCCCCPVGRNNYAHTCETICIRLRTPDIYQFIFYTSVGCAPFIEIIALLLLLRILRWQWYHRVARRNAFTESVRFIAIYFFVTRNSFGILMRNANLSLSLSPAISASLVSLCAGPGRASLIEFILCTKISAKNPRREEEEEERREWKMDVLQYSGFRGLCPFLGIQLFKWEE